MDPAVFFDMLKIRKLVEEATDLSVRAASGITSSALSNSLKAGNDIFGNGGTALGMGLAGGGSNAKLSRERKHRMREQATQKLSKAYYLDEIACSVATMQAASTLEDVANLVLQRDPAHVEGKYVHFFHEKIPSRQLAECTTLKPLDDVVDERPNSGEPLRTRAVTKLFKEDFVGAAQDLTAALQACRYDQNQHKVGRQELQLASTAAVNGQRHCRWKEDIKLDEEDHPSSLETQLLFHRAGAYLMIACQHIDDALPPKGGHKSSQTMNDINGMNEEAKEINFQESTPEKSPAEIEADKKRFEARKLVKTNAKRALRDYIAYLSHLDYSPGLPTEATEEFIRKVNEAATGLKIPSPKNHNRVFEMGSNSSLSNGQLSDALVPHPSTNTLNRRTNVPLPRDLSPPVVYQISTLFSATPPSDIPPYPSTSTSLTATTQSPLSASQAVQHLVGASDAREALTYHPLLIDALHSLLLCHCLVQTSTRELQRHAYMVARLARVCDGYPLFQPARSPSCTDWTEVLRRNRDKLALGASWEELCRRPGEQGVRGEGEGGRKESAKDKRERLRRQAVMEALEDERVCDDESFQKAVAARQRRQEEEGRPEGVDGARKWEQNEERYSLGTERAQRIGRWVGDAPVGESMGTKKKRKGAKNRPNAAKADGLSNSMSEMKVADENIVETVEEVD